MWDLGYRSIVALASVLTGCVFLYNVWRPILVLTILLFLTVYACYTLIVNDSSLSPHASFLFDYCVRVFLEVRTRFESIAEQIYRWSRTFWEIASSRFFEVYLTKFRMDRRRGTHYQLSADPYPTRRNSSKFDPITQLSPIPRNLRESNASQLARPNSSYARNSLTKLTSTPIFSQHNEEFENQSSDESPSVRGISPMYSRYRNLARGEEDSPWGTMISPKASSTMDKPSTSPGRPLSSARYNIDARLYQDVTSPGLAGRLSKYAAEAGNRLNHQSQYQVGQFPKVNLQGNPVPLINAKCIKTKTPVIVRVAPPDAVRYSPSGKQKILSNMCGLDDGLGSGSVPYGFREMPLKRHAEREDVTFDLAKKQRTGGVPTNEIETSDETKQKRSRDESSKSEEDVSPQNKTVRPAKRTKTPSCYDILHSFSSSRNLIAGIKRKARDLSRSGTPDFEKHFKSLESVGNSSGQTSPNPNTTENTNGKHRDHSETKASEKLHSNARNSFDRVEGKLSPLKGILKPSSTTLDADSRDKERIDANPGKRYNGESRSAEFMAVNSVESARLTNKLFMRAEPERNEKLRKLVEEQGNIRAKFTTDDVEEIKKEDIADMRQTSMKARLQSMFDAISGKATSKINPDVVIQAEEVNTGKSAPCSSASCATLNSTTTTTNANTTPITTSAIAPSPGTKPPKHVGFELPKKETPSDSNTSAGNVTQKNIGNVQVSNPSTSTVLTGSSGVAFTSASGIATLPSTATRLNSTMENSKVRGFDAGSATTTNNLVPSSGTFALAGGDILNHRASTTSASSTVPRTTPSAPHSIGDTTSGTMFSSIPTSIPTSVPAISSPLNAKTKTNDTLASQKLPSMSSTITGTSKPAFPLSLPSGWTATTTTLGSNALENKGQNALTRGIPATTTSSIAPTNAAATSMFSFGNKSTTSPPPLKSEPSFAFGSSFGGNTSTSASAPAGVPTFASPSQTNQIVGDSTKPAVASTTSSTSRAPSLSNPAVTTSATTTSAFDSSMKARTAAPLFQSAGLPSFSFGAVSSGASGNVVANSKPVFSFGNVAATTAVTNLSTGTSNTMAFGGGNNNLSKPTFATATTNSSNVGGSSQFNANPVSIFGNAATTSAGSVFGTTPGQSIFGACSTTSTTTATSSTSSTSAPSLFGSHPAATSANSTAIFSNAAATSGMANTSSSSIFGSVAKPSSSGDAGSSGSNMFSNANPTSAFGASGNIFGQTKPLSENLKSATGTFAGIATPIFGTPSTTVATLGGATSLSSNPTTSIFGATIVSKGATAPTFAATNVASPVFGSHSSNVSEGQNSMLHAFGGTTNIFGSAPSASASTSTSASLSSSAAPPIFGSPAALSTSAPTATCSSAPRSTVICNSTPNTFAGQSAANSTFGGATVNVPAPFGQNKTPTFGQASPFATPNVSANLFGSGSTSNPNNNNASGMFSFGASQKPPQQPAASFAFNGSGNNSNNNATASASASTTAAASSSTPFQFNATASKPGTTGFNFSAPSTTPAINFGTTMAPTFNASMPGMFSIGSGSTAPRSRSARTRKPR